MIRPFLIEITANQLINVHHIIGAEYDPPYAGPEFTDEDGEQVHQRPARLKLVITATDLEIAEWHDGALKAFAATSTIIRLRADDAERVWLLLQSFKLALEAAN